MDTKVTADSVFEAMGAVPADDAVFEALGAVPVQEPKKQISAIESVNAGIQQGATLGAAPMIQGGIEAVMDKLRSFGIDPTNYKNGFKADGPAVSDVNAQLATQGFKGDLGPQSSMDVYRGARDASTAEFDAAAAAHPVANFAGGLAGSIATLPLLPAKMLAPIGTAAKGAGMLTKAGYAAANAVPTAAVASANMSKGDLTKGEFGQVAQDTALGTALGAGLGGGLQLGGSALAKIGSKAGDIIDGLVPDVAKLAKNRGKAGVDVLGDQFYNDTNKNITQLAADIEAPITAKSQKQVAEHVEYLKNLDADQKALTSQFDDMTTEAKKLADLDVERQTLKHARDVETHNNNIVETARKLQEQTIGVRKKLGAKYNELDAAAEATEIYPDNRESLNAFMEEIADNAGLTETDLKSIAKRLEASMNGENPALAFRNTKRELNKLFDNNNRTVARAAKSAYAKTKADYASALEAGGYKELAADIADTNKKWMATAEIENEFIDNLKPNRSTGKVEVAPTTIDAVNTFKRTNPKEIAKSDFLSGVMNTMDPVGSPAQLKSLQDLAAKSNELKAFKPVAPEVPTEMPPAQAAELQRLQDLLAAAKMNKTPQNVLGNAEVSHSGQRLNSDVIGLIPKFESQSGDVIADNNIEKILGFLKGDQGDDFVNALKPRMKSAAEDVQIRKAVSKGEVSDIPVNMVDAARKFIGKSSATIGNKVGLGEKAIADNKMVQFASKAASSSKDFMTKPRSFLKTGVTDLTDASNEQITTMAERMAQQGAEGQSYARVLNEAQGKQGQSRSAVMFGLMQQPQFRELINKLNMESDHVSEPVK